MKKGATKDREKGRAGRRAREGEGSTAGSNARARVVGEVVVLGSLRTREPRERARTAVCGAVPSVSASRYVFTLASSPGLACARARFRVYV